MANNRRRSRGLTTQQVKDLSYAWHHAAAIGLSLNVMVSFRPIAIDDVEPADRCKLFDGLRNKLGVYARSFKFPFTAAWSREANKDGTGEHLHVLMHIPARRRAHFEETVMGWLTGASEVDVRPAHQRTRFNSNGQRLSAITYIAKQMTPQAWYNRGLMRQPGGPILGKRAGVTGNIGLKARQAISDRRNPFSATNAMERPRELMPEIAQSSRKPGVVEIGAGASAA